MNPPPSASIENSAEMRTTTRVVCGVTTNSRGVSLSTLRGRSAYASVHSSIKPA